jgi:hypothetical protein
MISQPVPSIRIAMPAGPGYCVKVATINTAGFWACNDVSFNLAFGKSRNWKSAVAVLKPLKVDTNN